MGQGNQSMHVIRSLRSTFLCEEHSYWIAYLGIKYVLTIKAVIRSPNKNSLILAHLRLYPRSIYRGFGETVTFVPYQ